MGDFLTSNEWQWRLLRTVVQGVLGVLVANLDLILGWCVVDPGVRALVVALVMAVLSPVMAEIGAHLPGDASAGRGSGA
ncbi:alanine racemase [Adlercreutzia sp. ZJ138]|uniref:alanine racemase n=1 Tax=Adlercreutzia sp. ZJ138 TaxID=2709405 RepID=UPI0013EC9C6D|nr:alanine racemase [Adlercreutzia sp. ZJ138]